MEIAKCTWDAVQDADGYNVYLDGVKVNEDLITNTHFYIPDLEPDEYEAYATSVQQGIESEPSEVSVFMIEAEVVALCDADGMEMGTDFWTMRIDETNEDIYFTKWNLDGTQVNQVIINNIPLSASNNTFVGLNIDETEFYLLNGSTHSMYAFNDQGVEIKKYDANAENVTYIGTGQRVSIARDGRILLYNSRQNDPDNLQVIDGDDFSLLHKATYQASIGTGIRRACFDACGNIIIYHAEELIILNNNYQEIFSINQDDVINGQSITALCVGVGKIYLAGFRDGDLIPVALLNTEDLDNITHSVIGHVDVLADLDYSSASTHQQSGVVDKDGNAWFTASSGEVNGDGYTGLIKVTPVGDITVWKELAVGDGGSRPTLYTEYTSPDNKLLVSKGRFPLSQNIGIIDLNTLDPASDIAPFETSLPDEKWGVFVPGQHSVFLGTDTSTAPE